MSDELKPCPFCNHAVAIVLFAMGEHWVMCPCCTASAGMFSDKSKAAEAWNTRAESAEVIIDEMVERALKASYRDIDFEYGTIEDALQACHYYVVRGWMRAAIALALKAKPRE